MTIDLVKAKHAIAILERERQEQQQRIRLAAEVKQEIDEKNRKISEALLNRS